MKDDINKSDSDQETLTILHESCGLMVCHLKQSLPNMMDAVDDILLDIAVKTTNSMERKKYFNAMHEIRLKREDIQRQCVENYVDLFNKELKREHRPCPESESSKDVSSMSMTATNTKIRNNCHQTLLNLEKRMGMIQKSESSNAISNPFVPEVICKALHIAIEQLGPGAEIRLIMFKCFEKHVTSSLNSVYKEIYNVLESGGSRTKPELKEQQSSIADKTSSMTDIAAIRQAVSSEVKNLLKDKQVPEFVSEFILKHWVILLIRIHDRYGKNSDSWQHAIDTVNDLVWSVGSISSKEDRSRFDKLWPDLIKRLRNGINMVSMTASEETDFISSLSKHRATLTRLGALSKTGSSGVTIINTDKIHALKMKINPAIVQPDTKDVSLNNTASESETMPSLRHARNQQEMEKQLLENYDEKVDFNDTGSENTTMPGIKKLASRSPFMDELLVDNKVVEGVKNDNKES